MVFIEFGNGTEWWTPNQVFARILAGVPVETERDREIEQVLQGAAGVGGLTAEYAGDRMPEIARALVTGLDRLVESGEQIAGIDDGHYRSLRATAQAVAAR